ncbi:MAG: acetate--CoA ligase family protein [Elusimicrobia bacterium]|nr:acetate--CoA ligase family protein [Elusimicrobiota bacterium]
MITTQLLNPRSIVVIGGSNNTGKPGGKILYNLKDGRFKGALYVVNPKDPGVQGIKTFAGVHDLPQVDLAILAIAAKFCVETVEVLAKLKNTKAFIILSAGFSEESEEGAGLEKRIVEIIDGVNGSLIGPNCIGFLNSNYSGVFTTPVPGLDPGGCDFISGSGATAVFIMESGIPKGLTFSSVYSVGNSAQIGVEEVLKYLDESFDPAHSSKVKLLYIENIKKPDMLLRHSASLIRKGSRIAAIKSGSSAAGGRAASSHTGALAAPDAAVGALLRKAGIVRCYGRDELTTVASIFMHKELNGKNIAIITHAGGPAIMLTDALSNGGMEIPRIEGPEAKKLLENLFPGSSAANPIDFLATGTARQLGGIMDFCENESRNIDAMIVIFGSPGLFEVSDVYRLLDEKMKTCKKPVFPVLPSVINAEKEIKDFLAKGRINFPDEVSLGNGLAKVFYAEKPALPEKIEPPEMDDDKIRGVINSAAGGYLPPEAVRSLLDAAGIPGAAEAVVKTRKAALASAQRLGYPVAMKAAGPIHKSEAGGVVLNVKNPDTAGAEFDRLIKLPGTAAILIQPMLSGVELFAGAKREDKFGHLVLCGLGGIFIEVLKDVSSGLAPLTKEEALRMIRSLKGYGIIKGARGQEGVNEEMFADIIIRLSALVTAAPEIFEMDINPLLGGKDKVVAVDARIRIEK